MNNFFKTNKKGVFCNQNENTFYKQIDSGVFEEVYNETAQKTKQVKPIKRVLSVKEFEEFFFDIEPKNTCIDFIIKGSFEEFLSEYFSASVFTLFEAGVLNITCIVNGKKHFLHTNFLFIEE